MSVLDQIRELEAQKAKLLEDAKQEALTKAHEAIKELNELGYNYQLVEGNTATSTPRSTGGRRAGVRDAVIKVIADHPHGISRADILIAMDAKGDKKAEQSISNALANAKKRGDILAEDGVYKINEAA